MIILIIKPLLIMLGTILILGTVIAERPRSMLPWLLVAGLCYGLVLYL